VKGSSNICPLTGWNNVLWIKAHSQIVI